jgi:hypothetical protein
MTMPKSAPPSSRPRRLTGPAVLAAGVGLTWLALSATASATSDTSTLLADRAWGGCRLSASVQNSIKNAVKNASGGKLSSVTVDFITVHSVTLDNDGQPLAVGGGNSGIILCTFPGTTANVTTETTQIPNPTNHPGSTNIDVIQVQQQAVQQYKINDGTRAGKIEKRVCQTTLGNTDCFRVFKP